MADKFKLNWSAYKSMEGSLCVFFPGGLQLYVLRTDNKWRATKYWRVWWSEKHPKIKGLSGRRFASRHAAMRAAEAVFVPMAQFAELIITAKVELTYISPLARKRASRPSSAPETRGKSDG